MKPSLSAAELALADKASPRSAAGTAVKSFCPSSDQAQSLGAASSRWETVYSNKINDGAGNEIDISESAAAIAVVQAKDHAALTAASRAAGDSHPIAAISGLADLLQPAAAHSDGLMAASDKSKLDGIDETCLVYKKQSGDIRLDARAILLGAGIDGSERPLIRLSPDGSVCVGDYQIPLTLQASERPSVLSRAQSGQGSEKIAFLSDLSQYVSVEQIAGGLAAKADLVDGKVPLPQLPQQAVPQIWEVDALSALTGLTEATAGDFASIGGGPEPGRVYMLVDRDHSDLANWIDLTKPGGVISVNNRDGSVVLDLADFPDVIAALAAKAPATSPALNGNPTAPTPTSSDNSARIATTAFVKNQGYALAGTTIATAAPLTGGGSLAANRTLAIADATISTKGAVKLSSAVNSDSETLAATSKAIKTTYDLAAAKAALVSPVFSGAPTAPTPAASDDSA